MIVLTYSSILKLSQLQWFLNISYVMRTLLSALFMKYIFPFIINQDHDSVFLICKNIIQKNLAKLQKIRSQSNIYLTNNLYWKNNDIWFRLEPLDPKTCIFLKRIWSNDTKRFKWYLKWEKVEGQIDFGIKTWAGPQ